MKISVVISEVTLKIEVPNCQVKSNGLQLEAQFTNDVRNSTGITMQLWPSDGKSTSSSSWSQDFLELLSNSRSLLYWD